MGANGNNESRRPDMSAALRPYGAAEGWHSIGKLTMRKPATLILIFLCLAGYANPSVQAQSSDRLARWVEKVTLGPEYGGGGKVCSRWVKTPKLSVFGAT